MFLPFGTRKGERLDERKVKDFAIKGTIRNIFGVEVFVAAALPVNPIEDFIHTFFVVFILDGVLLYEFCPCGMLRRHRPDFIVEVIVMNRGFDCIHSK